MPTAAITQNTQHVANGLALLIVQFREKPRFTALLAAFLNEGQQVENALYGLLVRQLNNPAVGGITLDTIGKIVGQTRQGMLDAQYIQFLQARIKTNLSDGHVETIIAIALLLLGSSTPIRFREYLKAVELEVDNVTIDAYVVWSQFLNLAKDAGTSLRFVFSKSPAASTLKFASSWGTATFNPTTAQDPGSAWSVSVGGGNIDGVFG